MQMLRAADFVECHEPEVFSLQQLVQSRERSRIYKSRLYVPEDSAAVPCKRRIFGNFAGGIVNGSFRRRSGSREPKPSVFRSYSELRLESQKRPNSGVCVTESDDTMWPQP